MALAVTEAVTPRLAIVSSLDCYLRHLYSRVGTPHCLECGSAIEPQSSWEIAARLATLPPGTLFELLSQVTNTPVEAQWSEPKPSNEVKGKSRVPLQAPGEDEQEEFMAQMIRLVSAALRAGNGVVIVRITREGGRSSLMTASDRKVCVVCGTNFRS